MNGMSYISFHTCVDVLLIKIHFNLIKFSPQKNNLKIIYGLTSQVARMLVLEVGRWVFSTNSHSLGNVSETNMFL